MIVHIYKHPIHGGLELLCTGEEDHSVAHRRHIDIERGLSGNEKWCPDCESHPNFPLILLANTDLK